MYRVTVTFTATDEQVEIAPLAAFRDALGEGGWGIRIEEGVVYAGVASCARLPPREGERSVVWSVDGMEHTLSIDGAIAHETTAAPLELPEDGALSTASDPAYPGLTYPGVVQVEVVDE
jgi:hypothetical protein